MDQRLVRLIDDYLARTQEGTRRLQQSGFPLPESQDAWTEIDIPMCGSLINRTSYYKHSYGITIKWDDTKVEFYFGPSGETDCFDLLFMIRSFGDSLETYGFTSKDEIRLLFWAAQQAQEIRLITYSLFQLNHETESEWAAQSKM